MGERLNVLLVEDNKIDRMAFERFIRRENLPYEIVIAGSISSAREVLDTTHLDIMITDYLLGDGTAFDLLDETKNMPVIVITGSGDEEIAVKAMKAGASEYLIKDPQGNYLTTLPITVESAIRRRHDADELKQYREHLEELVAERTAELSKANEHLRAESGERKRAQEEVQLLGQIVQQMKDAVILTSAVPDSRIRYVNDAFTTVYGYTRDEVLGQPARVLFAGDDAEYEWLMHKRDETIAYEDQCRLEYQDRRKDGSAFWVSNTLSIVQLGEAQEPHHLGIIRDNTEQVQAELVLRRYAERLRTLHAIDGAILAAWSPEDVARATLRHTRQLIPCLGAGVVMFDFETQEGILFAVDVSGKVGPEARTRFPLQGSVDVETLGQGRILVEQGTSPLSPPLRQPRDDADIGRASTDSGQPFEASVVAQALRAADARSYVAAPLIAHGALIGTLILVSEAPEAFTPEHVDITREIADQIAVAIRQAHLRAALEAEERRLEAVVEHLPEGILLLNSERRTLLSNATAQAYLSILGGGEPGDELTHLAGRPVEELLEPPSEGMWHELEIGGPARRDFEVAARPVRTGTKSKRDDWVLVIRDVTKAREVQQHIQKQERLAAIGQLAGGIAHDFNNLLTTIMLYVQMLQQERFVPSSMADGLDIILNETRQAADLVGQILDFSRSSPIETHLVYLKPIIKEATRVLERTIPENIRLVSDIGPGDYIVNADPTRIQQVLMNLVVNARDAMPAGGQLRIGLSQVEVAPNEEPPVTDMAPGKWICMAVSDTGTGIPPDVLPSIFEPFFTTKAQGKGTGLGLAQVYGIVTQHEGHVSLETEVEHGTTFRVYLPDCGHMEAEIPSERTSTAPQGGGETILLVEDDKRIRVMTRRSLESLGYQVLTAVDGQDALEVHEAAGEIDLLVTDMVMPEMGGQELIQELRKQIPDLRAVVITGYALPKSLEELKEEGAVDIVRKPFDINVLAGVVRRVLDSQEREKPAKSPASPATTESG
jgi:PAS domain S-box-containing protein